jgi:hypothetical protein
MKAGDVLKAVVDYFGPEGLGLQVTQRTLIGVRLEGGGGFVQVSVHPGKPTDVDLVIHEWGAHTVTFMCKIKK